MRSLASLLILAGSLFVAGNAAAGEAQADPSGWQLVWSDEFEGSQLDKTKWKPEKSCWGGGNDERQCYTGRPKNIVVSGGMLKLIAYREDFTGPDRPPEIASMPNPNRTQPFTSGKIRTRGLASWRYGRIEFRARVPRGQGAWPAVWMMPAEDHYGAWPLSGEIDILESVNQGAACPECKGGVGENRSISALHFGDKPPRNQHIDTRVAPANLALMSDQFHVWTLEWGQGLMRFYLDGKLYWQVTASQWRTGSSKAKGNPLAPFDRPFYLMANLAIGGKLAEQHNSGGIDLNALPAEFTIDWIRVYQCGPDRETGLACMKDGKGGN